MRTLWARVRRTAWVMRRVGRLEWRGEWTPGMREVRELLQDESDRQRAAIDAMGSKGDPSMLLALTAWLDEPDVRAYLDGVLEQARTADGQRQLGAAFEHEVFRLVSGARPSERWVAFQVAKVALVAGCVIMQPHESDLLSASPADAATSSARVH